MTFLSHCHSSVSRNSGGHGQVIQLGQVALSLSPGQPENVTTTETFSNSASRTDLRNASSYSCATFLLGCSGLPWHDRELMVNPASRIWLRNSSRLCGL